MKRLSTRAVSYRHVAALLAVAAAACSEPPASENAPTAPVNGPSATLSAAASQNANEKHSVQAQLDQLRDATEQFKDFNATTGPHGQYSTPLTGCMVDPTLGGMGFHYGKASAIDGTIKITEPEALLYEPQKNGKFKLVAVEFLVPYAIVPRDAAPPRAFGLDFIPNDDFKLWTLHAWVFKHNPAGTFASWNPKVNCDAVPAAERESHSSHSSH